MVSFLNVASDGFKKRGVLDIYNRYQHKNEGIEVIDAKSILEDGKNLRQRLNMKARKQTDSGTKNLLFFLKDLTEQYIDCNVVVDEVELDLLMQKQVVLHHKNFTGSMWIAISSKAKYDFVDDTKKPYSTEFTKLGKTFQIICLTQNMRNGQAILERSCTIQKDKQIEQAIIPASIAATNTSNNDDQKPTSLKRQARINFLDPPGNKKLRNEDVEDIPEREENVDTIDEDKEEVSNSIESRPVVYTMADNISTVHCPTIQAMEPTWFRGAKAENYLKTDIADMVKERRVNVILGKDEEDLEWIREGLKHEGVTDNLITIYDGMEATEDSLEKFLEKQSTVLLTSSDLFDGMEAPTVVYAFTDPYPWLRRTFLRAIRELILLDRNDSKMTDNDQIIQTIKGRCKYD